MSTPALSSATTDRNLLFGILGLQEAFFSREALESVMGAWAQQQTTPLGQLMQERGVLSADRAAALEALVDAYLHAHGADPLRSLMPLPPSVAAVYRQVAGSAVDSDAGSEAVTCAAAEPSATRTVDHAAPTPAAAGPTCAGRYRIRHSHARGGLGEVFVAQDEEVHREVALKQIQEQFADHAVSRARFVREAEITGSLEHPGIVPVYGLGQYADGRPFYAMRFIRGDSLKEAIERFHRTDSGRRHLGDRTLELRQLLGRFIAVCNTMAYAHSRGVLHRDLKPANVMLGYYGETLVVDWGLAKQFNRTEVERASGETSLPTVAPAADGATQAGQALGTPAYMSPEQAAGRLDALGPASDIYSLGAMLYTLLTGVAPFRDPSAELILVQVIQGEFPRPRQVKRSVPRALEAICLKAMARKPADRYESARALADDVEHWLADDPVTAHRESLWERTKRLCRRRPVYAAGMGFILAMDAVVFAAVVGTLTMRDSGFLTGALASLPFILLGGMIGITVGVLFMGQLWWLIGAVVGAILGSRGALIGGLAGCIVGGLVGLLSFVTAGIPGIDLLPIFAWICLPIVGSAGGMCVGVMIVVCWAAARKYIALSMLVPALLGMIAFSLAAGAIDPGSAAQQLVAGLRGAILAGVAGTLIGTIVGAIPTRGRKAVFWASLGGAMGLGCAGICVLWTVHGMDQLVVALVAGGLVGAAIGAWGVCCRSTAGQRSVRIGFLGGWLGFAVGTWLSGLSVWYVMTLGDSLKSDLGWIALPVIVLLPVLHIGPAFLYGARGQRLLTHATRGAFSAAVLGSTLSMTLAMADTFFRVRNPTRLGAGPGALPKVPAVPERPGISRKTPVQPLDQEIVRQENLVRNSPKFHDLAANLGALYLRKARGAHGEDALAAYDKAITTLEGVVKSEPRHAKAREMLRDAHAARANVMLQLARSADAAADWQRAVELDSWPTANEYRLQRALAQARMGERAQALATCDALAKGKDLSAETLYKLGRVYARCGEADRAMGMLKQAVAAGYRNFVVLRSDIDVDSLRQRDDFKELLATVTKGKAKQ